MEKAGPPPLGIDAIRALAKHDETALMESLVTGRTHAARTQYFIPGNQTTSGLWFMQGETQTLKGMISGLAGDYVVR